MCSNNPYCSRCYLTCHPGECGSKSECRKRVKLTCQCKRIKRDVLCFKTDGDKLTCDDECREIKRKVRGIGEELLDSYSVNSFLCPMLYSFFGRNFNSRNLRQ